MHGSLTLHDADISVLEKLKQSLKRHGISSEVRESGTIRPMDCPYIVIEFDDNYDMSFAEVLLALVTATAEVSKMVEVCLVYDTISPITGATPLATG